MSEAIITTTLTPDSGTTYLQVADLRSGTERYPDLWVKGDADSQVEDLTLLQMIADASDLLDRATGDHFLPTSGTLVVDGPGADGWGRTGRVLFVPRRLRSVTGVSQISTDGSTLDAYDPTTYRVHSSLTDPAIGDTPIFLANRSYDGIEFVYGPSSDSLTLPSWSWGTIGYPSYPRAVAVEGTFDWPSPPEAIKQATAWIVLDWARGAQTPARTKNFTTGGTFVELDAEGYTGIAQVDRVIAQYRRAPFALRAV